MERPISLYFLYRKGKKANTVKIDAKCISVSCLTTKYEKSHDNDGSMPIILVNIVSERSVYLGFVGRQNPLDAVIIAFILFTVFMTKGRHPKKNQFFFRK